MELGKYTRSGRVDGNIFVPERKEWVQAALAGASVLSSLIGGAAARRAAKRAERRQRAREAEESAWYNRRYNEDYIDTAAGQNLVRKAKEFAKEQTKRAEGAEAVAGGSNAATARSKEAANKMVGETIANISAQDTQRKAHVDDIHQGNRQTFANEDEKRAEIAAQNTAEVAAGASNAAIQAVGALAGGESLLGGSNKGTNVVESVPDEVNQAEKLAALYGKM